MTRKNINYCLVCDIILINRNNNAKYCKPCARAVRDEFIKQGFKTSYAKIWKSVREKRNNVKV